MVLSVGAALLSPLWQPLIARWGRPAAKGAVKGGFAAYEVARGRLAEFGEKAQDLMAEVQIERAADRAGGSTPLDPHHGQDGPTADR